jgi:hypothetical protein
LDIQLQSRETVPASIAAFGLSSGNVQVFLNKLYIEFREAGKGNTSAATTSLIGT